MMLLAKHCNQIQIRNKLNYTYNFGQARDLLYYKDYITLSIYFQFT